MASRPELKLDDEVGFIRFFRNLPSKDEETIRIFDRGDWYSAHGDDAAFIARTVYKTTSVLRQLGRSDNGLASVTMTITVYRNFLREALFRLGKRIEVYEATSRMNWKVSKQASPGNLQDIEDELGGQIDSAPIILAVKVTAKASEARTVGVCFADASVRELGVSEFLDNDLYSNFESMLIQLGVKECLIQTDVQKKDVELGKLRSIADNCGCAVTERVAADFGTRDIEQDLTRLLRDERSAGTLPQTDLKLAMGSAAALIKYLGVMHDPSNFGQYQLYQHDLSQFMKLDASALKALNLMPGPRDGSKNMSLFGLLNHCKTPVGSRLLAQWLKQPLMSLEEIEKRQLLVEAFVVDTELRQTMQEEHLRSIPDLYRLSKRFQRKVANLEDVVRGYQVAIRLPGFLGTLEAVMDEKYRDPLDAEYTSKIKEYSDSLARLQEMVETTVDLDALDNHEFIIKPEFDDSLRTIRKKLDKLRYDMEKEHESVGDDLNQDTEKKLFLENHRVHGWCFRLTRNEAGCIRNKKQYQECSTQKNGVYFTTAAMQTMRREFDQLSQNYNRTQSGLVNEVVNVAASYCPVFEHLAAVLAHLDVIVSFAHVSVHAPTQYVRPQMHARGQGDTVLKEARHPCMEMQDDIQFITNDVELRRGSSEFLIITGPNMGGKSTYIRQVGVIALMAQVGCWVPCSEAELTLFDCILARVGASDSQIKGVSTFMAEMLETANILKTATSESLIIIDELGRGTSTYDGFGLAWAISEHIVREIKCFSLFATHFHELTALVEQYPAVKNLHVTAHIGEGPSSSSLAANGTTGTNGASDDEERAKLNKRREVTLLYKVQPGVCDQSFGIHVAELVRFPPKVVNMAKRKADELEDFTVKHDQETAHAMAQHSKEDVEQGSAMLKDVLMQWKQEVEAAGGESELSKEEKIQKMKDLVMRNEELLKNPFFQAVKAL
ncbi:DNA mismatch repair protein [Xylona heveae TC161]|uniref:DNA mismatch repair protein n=1 Tax=Xylona heveae (strain CBS 132557 / TC161) TaxID=1328760 RepID=A0A165G9G7_XYLHT|nr:DNA mismatch repair protein [Xylona heveae TC161]KZF21904.1 DNA mismatch repair protein [Xylona heveae TC161]